MVVRISDKTQNYSKVTKLLVKPCFFDRVTRRAEFFDPVRISNISFHNNSVHQYTIKAHKKINNLKSRNFEDYFMRNHYQKCAERNHYQKCADLTNY